MDPLNMDPVEEMLEQLPRYTIRKRKIAAFYAQLAVFKTKRAFAHLSTNIFTMSKVRSWGAAALLAVFVLMASFSFSPSVTRGHFLYPVKRAAEKAELALSWTAPSKAYSHMKFSERRLDETKVLLNGGGSSVASVAYAQDETVVEGDSEAAVEVEAEASAEAETEAAAIETLGEAVAEVDAAVDAAAEITDTEDAAEVLGALEETLENQTEEVAALSEDANSEAVGEALAETLAALEETEVTVVEANAAVEDALEDGEETVTLDLGGDEASDGEDDEEDAEPARHEDKARTALEAAGTAQTEMLAELTALGLTEADAQKLVDRVADKLEKATEACESGNYGKCNGLSRAVQSLTNNAKSYAKRNENSLGGDDDENDEDDEEEDSEDGDESDDEGAGDDEEGESGDEGVGDDEVAGEEGSDEEEAAEGEAEVDAVLETDVEAATSSRGRSEDAGSKGKDRE